MSKQNGAQIPDNPYLYHLVNYGPFLFKNNLLLFREKVIDIKHKSIGFVTYTSALDTSLIYPVKIIH